MIEPGIIFGIKEINSILSVNCRKRAGDHGERVTRYGPVNKDEVTCTEAFSEAACLRPKVPVLDRGERTIAWDYLQHEEDRKAGEAERSSALFAEPVFDRLPENGGC